MIHKLETPDLAAPLFKDWAEGMIWACLQGRMGAVLANDTLSSAAAVLGDCAFFRRYSGHCVAGRRFRPPAGAADRRLG